ncbi:DgyrCDS13183 [Dimorphilus gyrociliatus]|uniref:non-specific serine/threonine protein kinase n=1 Tax=Dimorphilus gyrociliatus TaxID=2664684 RepID=A0A7I8W9X8_9ANNE|nr:DgyrCDS13183 [Dimorphilus gyrociliatus]
MSSKKVLAIQARKKRSKAKPRFKNEKSDNKSKGSQNQNARDEPAKRPESYYEEEEDDEEDEILGSDDDEQEDRKDYCVGGYHPVKLGDLFQQRYHVVRKLGWGHFSTVWLCWDLTSRRFVALKVVKSAQHYTETAMDEIKLLKCVRDTDPSDPYRDRTVQLLDDFKVSGVNGTHVCMVFEVLGHNLLKLIVKSQYRGIPLPNVKKIIGQVLQSLHYLHEKCRIIHTDIKPENVLICVDENYVRQLAQTAAQWQKSGIKAPGSAISTALAAAPHAVDIPTAANQKLSKNKKKKMKKKLKKQKLLLQKQEEQLEELDKERTDSVDSSTCREQELQTATSPLSPLSPPSESNDHVTNIIVDPDKEDKTLEEFVSIVPIEPGSPISVVQVEPPEPEPEPEPEAEEEPVPEAEAPPRVPERPKSIDLQENGQHLCNGSNNITSEENDKNAEKSERASSEISGPKITEAWHEVCDIDVKIADLGNACWTYHHFTDDIQTRQYRSLEVLLGSGYDAAADIWSTACMAFELATGDYLFEPHTGDSYTRDEDHIAHIIELLGPIPKHIALSGRYSREYFNKKGDLRHISQLKPWPLFEVLTEKYEWDPQDAVNFTSFLLPMLHFDPSQRATAEQCLQHPWLNENAEKDNAPIYVNEGLEDSRGDLNSADYVEII